MGFTLRCTVIPTTVSVATKVQAREQPAVRATGTTYLRLTDPQAVRKQILAAKAELAQLQAPCSLPENSRSHQHSMGEWLSSTAWALARPSVCEVTQRPEGRWFRKPSLGEALVICELPVTGHIWPPPTRWDFVTNSRTHLSLPETLELRRCRLARSLCTRCFGRQSAASSFVIVLLSHDAEA